MSLLRRLRDAQIRLVSRWVCALGDVRAGRAVLRVARQVPGLVPLCVGYRRPFATLSAAAAAIDGFDRGGHSNKVGITLHANLANVTRVSDYAALHHLGPLASQIRSVFDLGGNVGNLFYLYSKHLAFPADLRWTVQDLPAAIEEGRTIAIARAERRLDFTTILPDKSFDLLIVSGAMHYFETPLPQLIAKLPAKPRWVLVNRSPMIDGANVATVQDTGSYLVASMLYDRATLIAGFEAMEYQLVDRWDALELSLKIPFYDDRSAAAYTGMFFALRSKEASTFKSANETAAQLPAI
jgi:putative methyltransferase (TIGR04325 family)